MSLCNKCTKQVKVDELLQCNDCKAMYHFSCTKIRTLDKYKKLSAAAKLSWSCDLCTGDSSNRGEDSGECKILESIEKMRQCMSQQVSEVNNNVTEVKGQLATVNEAIASISQSLGSLAKENEARKKEVEELVGENKALKIEVNYLKDQVSDLQQYTRKNNIEIVGVPQTARENIYFILQRIAEVIKVDYDNGDVSVAHRLPLSKNSKNKHPTIVVQFVSRTVKSSWVAGSREHRDRLTAAALDNSFEATRVYINDHLTGSNKVILGRARDLMRQKKLTSAWTVDCKIWVRQTKEGRAIRVSTLQDLDKVLES